MKQFALFPRIARATLMIGAAILVALGASIAAAQTAEESASDPPGRVGRLSHLSGPVQLIDTQTGQGEPATLNWPVTSATRLATGRLGRAEVRIGSLSVRLDDSSEVEFARIDDETMQMIVLRGSIALRVRNREHLREVDLLTPHERIVLDDVGRYRVDVGEAPGQAGLTALTAWNGRARITNGTVTFSVASGQRGELEHGSGAFRLVGAAFDNFDDWVAARDTRDDASRSARYVSPEMTGFESLDDHGTWREVQDYGTVWFPIRVVSGWVPYRHGRWAWIAPWGWTWIDDAPWGFAPFHYGRWAVIGGVWGWVPGVYAVRPVYAPALVAWFGGPGISASISFGSPPVPIGWFPLAPREIFVPGYRCSRRHIDIVNTPHVVNITNITVINPPPRYLHQDRDRSTWAPHDVLRDRSPVYRVKLPPPADWQNHVVAPRPNVEIPRGIKKHPVEPRPAPRFATRADPAPARAGLDPRAVDEHRFDRPRERNARDVEPRGGPAHDRSGADPRAIDPRSFERPRERDRRDLREPLPRDGGPREPLPRDVGPRPGDRQTTPPARDDERAARPPGRGERRANDELRRDERQTRPGGHNERREERRVESPRDELRRDMAPQPVERRALPVPIEMHRDVVPRPAENRASAPSVEIRRESAPRDDDHARRDVRSQPAAPTGRGEFRAAIRDRNEHQLPPRTQTSPQEFSQQRHDMQAAPRGLVDRRSGPVHSPAVVPPPVSSATPPVVPAAMNRAPQREAQRPDADDRRGPPERGRGSDKASSNR